MEVETNGRWGDRHVFMRGVRDLRAGVWFFEPLVPDSGADEFVFGRVAGNDEGRAVPSLVLRCPSRLQWSLVVGFHGSGGMNERDLRRDVEEERRVVGEVAWEGVYPPWTMGRGME